MCPLEYDSLSWVGLEEESWFTETLTPQEGQWVMSPQAFLGSGELYKSALANMFPFVYWQGLRANDLPRQACFGELRHRWEEWNAAALGCFSENQESSLFPLSGYYSQEAKDRSDASTDEMTVTGLEGDELVPSLPYNHISWWSHISSLAGWVPFSVRFRVLQEQVSSRMKRGVFQGNVRKFSAVHISLKLMK